MRSVTIKRRLGVRLAIYFAASAGLVVCRHSNAKPDERIVCLGCGTVYERVRFP